MVENAVKKTKMADWRSLVIGFLLGLCALVGLGAAMEGSGKYQCCAAGDDGASVFVIDTQTGQTWRLGRSDSYDYGTPIERKSERRSETPKTK